MDSSKPGPAMKMKRNGSQALEMMFKLVPCLLVALLVPTEEASKAIVHTMYSGLIRCLTKEMMEIVVDQYARIG